MSAASSRFQSGDVIASRYQLQSQVGEGGMGSVWRAKHIQLDSDVAIKLINPAIAQDPEALNRFLREARSAARLSSLHVVKVFDYGVDGDTPFIAMELLKGESLRERLEREGSLSPAATLRVLVHASRALAKAHAEGIVHRDLKPENLFITHDDEELVKVLDFGVAKLRGSSPGLPTSKTRTGALLGTPFYMSPEQAQGTKAVDQRSDIWSLGVIAFECLTGKLPFDSGALGDLILRICVEPIVVPSAVASVPAGFDAWFASAVSRDPEQRFGSVEEMSESLARVLGASPHTSPTPASASLGAQQQPAARAGSLEQPQSRIDVTASRTVLAAIARRAPGRRRIVLAASACAVLALLLLLRPWRADAPAQPSAASALAPAALPMAVASPAPLPAASAAVHEGLASTSTAAAAPGASATSTVTPAPSAGIGARRATRSENSAPRAASRALPAAPATPRSPAPARAPAKDLFSDPD